MEGRGESNRGGDDVYPATFGNEEETGLTLYDDGDDELALPIKEILTCLAFHSWCGIALQVCQSPQK